MAEKNSGRVLKYSVLAVIILAVAAGAFYMYMDYTKYVQTDDAFVDADNVAISSKILGRIVQLHAVEGDSVHQGDLLVELDSEDLIAQRNNMMAQRNQAVAAKGQAEAKLQYELENIKTIEIALARNTSDFQRAKDQVAGDVITKEQFEHVKNSYESSESQVNAAKSNLNVSKAQIGTTQASIEMAESQIHQLETQLKNTKIYAPSNGTIAKRWLLAGEITQPGQSVFTMSNSGQLRILANIEETKMSSINVGQRATFDIDAFPDVEFMGHVVYLSPSAASQFALIPPNNAAGNFTKVTQRIPVKISIDSVSGSKKLSDYHLIAGMSAAIKILKKQ